MLAATACIYDFGMKGCSTGQRTPVAAYLASDSEVRIFAERSNFANFGIGGHWEVIDLAWLWFRSPHNELRQDWMRTSEPPLQANRTHRVAGRNL